VGRWVGRDCNDEGHTGQFRCALSDSLLTSSPPHLPTYPPTQAFPLPARYFIVSPLSTTMMPTAAPFCSAPAHASTPSGHKPKPRVLVVDDEETIRLALARYLRAQGYDVEVADCGAAAIARLEQERFVVMLCDVRMPDITGLDVVPQALRLDADLAILMLTAVNDAGSATDALSHGALDYLVKPIELAALQRAVERATHRRQLGIERRRVEEQIREEVELRTVELEHEKSALRDLTIGVAEALINAMEAKDIYLRGHSRRVADQAASIADELGLDADVVENVRLAGRLHDVGKIGIREEILNKPGVLTQEEFEHVKQHVQFSTEILAPLKHIPVAITYVSDHHEHYDGSGYPRGLAGEQISIGGRIVAACDAFDALTSRRAFRDAMDPDETIRYLGNEVGRLLDPQVYQALRTVVQRGKTLTFIDDLGE
jgi:putative two-component system response regulator